MEGTHPLQYALVGVAPARYVSETGALTDDEVRGRAGPGTSPTAVVARYEYCPTCRTPSPCPERAGG